MLINCNNGNSILKRWHLLLLKLTHSYRRYSFILEPVAPPKKPPRPGAPCHLANLGPVESYNEGVKVYVTHTHKYIQSITVYLHVFGFDCVHAAPYTVVFGLMCCPSSLPFALFSLSLTSTNSSFSCFNTCCVAALSFITCNFAFVYSPITLSALSLPFTSCTYIQNSFKPPHAQHPYSHGG